MKTYTGTTMAEALGQVRQDLGANAVILHTRAYRRGGFLGFGAKPVIEITAADGASIGRNRRQESRNNAAAVGALPQQRRPERRRPEPRREAMSTGEPALAGDLIRRTYAAARADFEKSGSAGIPTATPDAPASFDVPGLDTSTATKNEQAVAEAVSAAAMTPAAAPAPGVQYIGNDTLVDEMRFVREMVAKVMRQQRTSMSNRKGYTPIDMPGKLFDQYLHLLEQEVSDELAEEIVAKVKCELPSADIEDEDKVRGAVACAIAKLLPGAVKADASETIVNHECGTEFDTTTTDGRPRTIALIGPTGVGKTTTIAKLAATYKLKHRKHVGLITLDTYRIAAVEQLRTYANIIGLALHVVKTPEELPRALKQCAGCDVVLIDTAGRSQRDDPKLEELSRFISLADPHDVHLVLSSTCTQSAMLDAVERFSRIRTDSIIFTKLDEAVSFGVMVNVARKVNKRLSYMTTGQEVPHDIEPGRADRLARIVISGQLVQTDGGEGTC